MALYIVCFVSMILFFRSSNINASGGVFDKPTSESLKGMAMCAIILHHIHNNIEINSRFFSLIGFIATAVFFFISGYGNSISLRGINNENESLRWFVKRLRVYRVFLISYILYTIVLAVIYHEFLPIIAHTVNVLTFTLPNQITWFPKVYLAIVLIHSGTHYFVKREKMVCAFLLCFILAWILTAWLYDFPPFWYNSIICYAVGSFCCIYTDKLKKICNEKYGNARYFIAMIGLLIALYCLPNRPLQIVTPITICVTLYMISMKWSVRSPIFRWIGKNSFEYYCFHIVALQACSALIAKGETIYSIGVIILSVLLVYIYFIAIDMMKKYKRIM